MTPNPSALTLLLAADGVDGAVERVRKSPWWNDTVTQEKIKDLLDEISCDRTRTTTSRLVSLVRMVAPHSELCRGL